VRAIRRVLVVLAVLLTTVVAFEPPATAITFEPPVIALDLTLDDALGAGQLLALANADRVSAGLAPLVARADVTAIALDWSRGMAAVGDIAHNDAYFTADMHRRLDAKTLGENVAMNRSMDDAHRRLMASPGHRANLLNPAYTVVGIAVVRDAGGIGYVTEDFVEPRSGSAVALVAPPSAAAAPLPDSPPAPAPASAPAAAPAPAPPAPVRAPRPVPPTPPTTSTTVAPPPPPPPPAAVEAAEVAPAPAPTVDTSDVHTVSLDGELAAAPLPVRAVRPARPSSHDLPVLAVATAIAALGVALVLLATERRRLT
jgi:uncharacterized protein YkwD